MKHLSKSLLILLIFIGPIILLNGCKKEIENSILVIFVSKNPDAGAIGSIQTAEISGNIMGSVKDIYVVIEWYWEDKDHDNLTMLSGETVLFNSYEEMTVSTQVELLDLSDLSYYWIELKWQDDDGSHMIESGKAYCKPD